MPARLCAALIVSILVGFGWAPAAEAQTRESIGVAVHFMRGYDTQFPGPEQGEPEIIHGFAIGTPLQGIDVVVSRFTNEYPQPGLSVPWRVVVRRGGAVLVDGPTVAKTRDGGQVDQVIAVKTYPLPGDVVEIFGHQGQHYVVPFDGLPALDSCVPGSGVVTGRFPPGPSPTQADLADRVLQGISRIAHVANGQSFTASVPGGPSVSLMAQSSRALDDALMVFSTVKADPPYCGGVGPRDGYLITGGRELGFDRRGVRLDLPRCSAYSSVDCRIAVKATARRAGRNVAAIRPRTIELAPGATWNKRLSWKSWIKGKGPKARARLVVKLTALHARPAPAERLSYTCKKRIGGVYCS